MDCPASATRSSWAMGSGKHRRLYCRLADGRVCVRGFDRHCGDDLCHVRGARWWIACMALGAAVVMQFHLPGGVVMWPILWVWHSVSEMLRQGVARTVAEVAFDIFMAAVSGAVGGAITGIPLAALLRQRVSERQS